MTGHTHEAVSERTEGPTPNGGTYAVAYFRDRDGNPCPRAEAFDIEIVEFDTADRAVFRTYLIPSTETQP